MMTIQGVRYNPSSQIGGPRVKLALTGDVMLGRLVDEYLIHDVTRPVETVWGDLLPFLTSAERRLVNLECVISRTGQPWHPDSKAFHFRSAPRAVEVLQAAHIDCVTLANNHALDYGAEALVECLALLDNAGIQHTGAGADLEAAAAPVFLETTIGRVAVCAITDNEPEWEATVRSPGVNFVEYDERGLIEPYRSRVMDMLRRASREAPFVVVSAHVGPNWGPPSRAMRALAHQFVAIGADVYWGHSNHTPQGIEIVDGKLILYSTGDFIDDYAVDPLERNDLSFLFLLEACDGRPAALMLVPITIDHCTVRRAADKEAAFLATRMQAQCRSFGTPIEFREGMGRIAIR